MLEHAISDFGNLVGLANLTFDDDGVICLSGEKTDVYLERIRAGLLAYIVQEVSYADADTYCKLLASCHYENKSVARVNPGLSQDGKLMLTMKFEGEQVTGRQIQQGLLYIQAQMASVTK